MPLFTVGEYEAPAPTVNVRPVFAKNDESAALAYINARPDYSAGIATLEVQEWGPAGMCPKHVLTTLVNVEKVGGKWTVVHAEPA